jgi:hypothetical protein
VRKDDSGLEDELEYFWEVPSPSDPYEREEDRWWSPGPLEPSSEEDEEEVQYLTKVLGLGPEGDEAKGGEPSLPTGMEPGIKGSSRASRGVAGRNHLLSRVGSHQGPPKVWNRLVQERSKGGNSGRR